MPRGIRGAEVAGGEGIGAAALAYLRRGALLRLREHGGAA